jgi:predicted DNA-binding protein (MmcQ/YjbR family)
MLEWLRPYCLSFPYATESLQWEALVFKVAGKIFAIAALEPDRHVLSIKCAEEKFGEMVECPGVAPAPYLARAKWIAFESEDAVPHQQLRGLIRESYDLVFAKLPRKACESLAEEPARRPTAERDRSNTKRATPVPARQKRRRK